MKIRFVKNASHMDISSSLLKTFVSKNTTASGRAATLIAWTRSAADQINLGEGARMPSLAIALRLGGGSGNGDEMSLAAIGGFSWKNRLVTVMFGFLDIFKTYLTLSNETRDGFQSGSSYYKGI
jgi:hypothetical protein